MGKLQALLYTDESSLTGGAEKQVRNEQRYLEDLGYTVKSVALEGETESPFVDEEIPQPTASPVRRVAGMSLSLRVYRGLRSVVTEFDPDIVHIHKSQSYPATVALATRDYPSIKTHHDYSTVCPSAWAVKQDSYEVCECGVGAKCFRHGCRSLPVVVGYYLPQFTVQKPIERRLIDRHIAPSARLTEYLNRFGYDAQQVRNPESVRETDEVTDEGFLLYIGRLSEEKGVTVLIDAVEQLGDSAADIAVKIAGSGPLEGAIRRRVEQGQSDSIEMLGYVSQERKRALLETARAVIVPSVWVENYPTVVLEAMAHGKPVIGSDRGGIGEMVTSGHNGLLYSATDSAQLATHIETLASDPAAAQTMGKHGRQWLSEHSNQELFGQKIRAIFHDLASCDANTDLFLDE